MANLELTRHEAIRTLCQAYAEDRISVEMLEARLTELQQANNESTIAAILAQLDGSPTGVTEASSRAMAPVAPAEYLRVASIFGSTKRAGSWTVPLHLHCKILFGELVLDLRDAVFASDFVEISVNIKFGSFRLLVPGGTQVENEMEEVLSASSHSTRNPPSADQGGRLVRITGRALMSSIEIVERPRAGQPRDRGRFEKLSKR